MSHSTQGTTCQLVGAGVLKEDNTRRGLPHSSRMAVTIPAPQCTGEKSSAEMSQESPKIGQRAPGPSPPPAHTPSTAGTNRAVPAPGLVRTLLSPWGVMTAGAIQLLSKSYETHVVNCRFPGKSTALTNNLPVLSWV